MPGKYLDEVRTQELINQIKARMSSSSDTFTGTEEEWNNLTIEQKNIYNQAYILDGALTNKQTPYIVATDFPGGDTYAVGNFWFVTKNEETSFTALTNAKVDKVYRYLTDSQSNISSWTQINPVTSNTAPSSATLNKVWIKTNASTGAYEKISVCTATTPSVVWKEVYPEAEEGQTLANVYLDTDEPITKGTYLIIVNDLEQLFIRGLYKYELVDNAEKWNTVYNVGTGGNVGLNVGKHNEVFGDYEHNTVNISKAEYNTLFGYGNKILGNGGTYDSQTGMFIIGYNNILSGHGYSTFISGASNTITSTWTSIIGGGNNTITNCNSALIVGTNLNVVSGNISIALGLGNTLNGGSGSCNFIGGSSSSISPTQGSSGGSSLNFVYGDVCSCIGNNNVLIGNNLHIGLYNNKGTYGFGSALFGGGNTVYTGDRVLVCGYNNEIENAANSIIIGQNQYIHSCRASIIVGEMNDAKGSHNGITGYNNADYDRSSESSSPTTGLGNFTCGSYNDNFSNYGFMCGSYGKSPTSVAARLMVGYGSSSSDKGCSFYVDNLGDIYSAGTLHSIGADYAEYFEWLDGNPNKEQRYGLIVALEGDKIKPANGTNILGIISSKPSLAGNASEEHWSGKYKLDIFGNEVLDEEGNRIINEDFDPSIEYLPRSQRPEWAAVGFVGRLTVIDNGKCKVGECVGAVNGFAVPAKNSNIIMLKRKDKTHIEVLIK